MSMHSTWMSFRSLTQDSSVKNQKLKPGTLKRIAGFAIPYKVSLTFFLITVVIDAFLIVATPLLLRKLIDDGVIPKNIQLVTQLALAVGIIAVLDALFSMIGRWFSARIGEGLIYDLRRMIFEHVQKQSIAFFTRTQTGALISRLNSDVIGAQQAFTSTLSGVISNLLSLILVAATMLTLSWQITLISLSLLPVFLFPTKWVGRKLQGYTRQTFERAVSGPYNLASNAVIASNVPTVKSPLMARCPPTPYATAVATAAIEVSAIKKIRFNMAIEIPISATLRALVENSFFSVFESP